VESFVRVVGQCQLAVGLLNGGTVRGVGDLEDLVVGRHCLVVEGVERRRSSSRGELRRCCWCAKLSESGRVM